jgi:cytochrome c biogenesis protein CcdA
MIEISYLYSSYFAFLEGSLPDSKWVTMFILGLAMGLRHATDADHVVAVSTIVSKSKNIWRGFWIGTSWGLGHTIPLLILGLIILNLRDLMNNYEDISHYFEFLVALMLILLGLQALVISMKNKDLIGLFFSKIYNILKLPKIKIHDDHHHDIEIEKHSKFSFHKPHFRMKSFIIGIVHSLAGSAAVMLILLPSINNTLKGILFISLFGLGTIVSMSIMTFLLSLPFALGNNNKNVIKGLNGIAGVLSITLGVLLGSDILFATEFIWY